LFVGELALRVRGAPGVRVPHYGQFKGASPQLSWLFASWACPSRRDAVGGAAGRCSAVGTSLPGSGGVVKIVRRWMGARLAAVYRAGQVRGAAAPVRCSPRTAAAAVRRDVPLDRQRAAGGTVVRKCVRRPPRAGDLGFPGLSPQSAVVGLTMCR
jgi:hypothetical protein